MGNWETMISRKYVVIVEVEETGSASCPVTMCDTELSGFTFTVPLFIGLTPTI
jgi:hypothetical protein